MALIDDMQAALLTAGLYTADRVRQRDTALLRETGERAPLGVLREGQYRGQAINIPARLGEGVEVAVLDDYYPRTGAIGWTAAFAARKAAVSAVMLDPDAFLSAEGWLVEPRVEESPPVDARSTAGFARVTYTLTRHNS